MAGGVAWLSYSPAPEIGGSTCLSPDSLLEGPICRIRWAAVCLPEPPRLRAPSASSTRLTDLAWPGHSLVFERSVARVLPPLSPPSPYSLRVSCPIDSGQRHRPPSRSMVLGISRSEAYRAQDPPPSASTPQDSLAPLQPPPA